MVRREREIKKEREERRQERRGNREVRRDLVVPKKHTFPKGALVALSVGRKPRKNWHSMKPGFRNFPRIA